MNREQAKYGSRLHLKHASFEYFFLLICQSGVVCSGGINLLQVT
ncbi:hypothetical protein Q3H59_004278 [Pantoea sp. SORGH_AS 659]|nr:hypothetical protein [Pantoea sp. SORGH_AS_0659]